MFASAAHSSLYMTLFGNFAFFLEGLLREVEVGNVSQSSNGGNKTFLTVSFISV